MAVNLVSPGVSIKEIDLTLGGVVGGLDNVGAIAGPFEKGPVNTPVLIENEQQLITFFGKPKPMDDQYEYWMSASNFLSYGGTLQVIRCGIQSATNLTNAYSPISGGSTTLNLKIDNNEDYENNHTGDSDWAFCAKNPGSWANNLKVCVIDNSADQIISGINTDSIISNVFSVDLTRTGTITGFANTIGISTEGIVLGHEVVIPDISGFISTGTTVVGISSDSDLITISNSSLQSASLTAEFTFGFTTPVVIEQQLEVGNIVVEEKQNINYVTPQGTVESFTGQLRGLITGIGNSSINIKITDLISSDGNQMSAEYNINSELTSIASTSITVSASTGSTVTTLSNIKISDWYNSQTLGLSNSTIYWKNIASKPGTSQYGNSKSSKNDEIHVVIVDDFGTIDGNASTILERHLSLSKSVDGRISPSEQIYYKDYINSNSNYIFVGIAETTLSPSNLVGTANSNSYVLTSGSWGSVSNNTSFDVIGNKTYTFSRGTDYSGVGSYEIPISDVISGYEQFKDSVEYDINFIIGGPFGGTTMFEAQAKANALIAIAEERKDCIATISPYKSGVVNVSNSNTQTNNIVKFFSPLTSSSYAVFDSGYKYTLDRFNNRLVYIPCNSDVAGLMSRTSTNNYPWYSPAGSSRGSILNVVKLAYSPSQSQRDELYTKRINPIISSPGAGGFILFGDKTALSQVSAFDRINVRMLFLTIERSIEEAARAQLFEFNDAITRSNFVNIVEPYLRDVKAKRGISEFLVICDESNNTPEVIDSNEFKADIYVKPARSINYIGLTFVATRTGISFSEIVGNV